ncbi:hypothetical protein BC938DRAFT_476975, partial [Jimgerdemannia flammicorona]
MCVTLQGSSHYYAKEPRISIYTLTIQIQSPLPRSCDSPGCGHGRRCLAFSARRYRAFVFRWCLRLRVGRCRAYAPHFFVIVRASFRRRRCAPQASFRRRGCFFLSFVAGVLVGMAVLLC